MKLAKSKSKLVLLIISLVLGLVIFNYKSYHNVAACFNTPDCHSATTGTLKTVRYGYPATYRQTTDFTPTKSSAYANSSVEQKGFSALDVLANTIFWFALLNLVYGTLTKSESKSETVPKP